MAVLLSRTWRVRRQAQHTVRKLLSSLGGFKLAFGLLEELKAVLSSHKVRAAGVQNLGLTDPLSPPQLCHGSSLVSSCAVLTETLV